MYLDNIWAVYILSACTDTDTFVQVSCRAGVSEQISVFWKADYYDMSNQHSTVKKGHTYTHKSQTAIRSLRQLNTALIFFSFFLSFTMTWLNKRVQNGTADISGITSLSTENTRLDAMNCKTVLHHYFWRKTHVCVWRRKKEEKIKKEKIKVHPWVTTEP